MDDLGPKIWGYPHLRNPPMLLESNYLNISKLSAVGSTIFSPFPCLSVHHTCVRSSARSCSQAHGTDPPPLPRTKAYGSKHCLRRYLSLQIIVNDTPNTSFQKVQLDPEGNKAEQQNQVPSCSQWIGSRENLNRKPWVLTIKYRIGLSG